MGIIRRLVFGPDGRHTGRVQNPGVKAPLPQKKEPKHPAHKRGGRHEGKPL